MMDTIRGLLCRPKKWRNTVKTARAVAFDKVKHLAPHDSHRRAVTAKNRDILHKVLGNGLPNN